MMTDSTEQLKLPDGRTFDYVVRTSTRARKLRMQLSPQGLVVTQPLGVCKHQVTQWVESKRDWIAQHLPGMENRPKPQPITVTVLPTEINLVACGHTVHVVYTPTDSPQIAIHYLHTGTPTLTLSGAVQNRDFCIYALQHWMKGHARPHFAIMLQQAMQETGLSCQRFTVKDQSSRWGSCSTRGNINLNYKLLFLPPAWVRYTLIHELCHTVEMNHSNRFWELVRSFVPDYQQIHQEMKTAMQQLPAWTLVTPNL